jgi:hypothetical protein
MANTVKESIEQLPFIKLQQRNEKLPEILEERKAWFNNIGEKGKLRWEDSDDEEVKELTLLRERVLQHSQSLEQRREPLATAWHQAEAAITDAQNYQERVSSAKTTLEFLEAKAHVVPDRVLQSRRQRLSDLEAQPTHDENLRKALIYFEDIKKKEAIQTSVGERPEPTDRPAEDPNAEALGDVTDVSDRIVNTPTVEQAAPTTGVVGWEIVPAPQIREVEGLVAQVTALFIHNYPSVYIESHPLMKAVRGINSSGIARVAEPFISHLGQRITIARHQIDLKDFKPLTVEQIAQVVHGSINPSTIEETQREIGQLELHLRMHNLVLLRVEPTISHPGGFEIAMQVNEKGEIRTCLATDTPKKFTWPNGRETTGAMANFLTTLTMGREVLPEGNLDPTLFPRLAYDDVAKRTFNDTDWNRPGRIEELIRVANRELAPRDLEVWIIPANDDEQVLGIRNIIQIVPKGTLRPAEGGRRANPSDERGAHAGGSQPETGKAFELKGNRLNGDRCQLLSFIFGERYIPDLLNPGEILEIEDEIISADIFGDNSQKNITKLRYLVNNIRRYFIKTDFEYEIFHIANKPTEREALGSFGSVIITRKSIQPANPRGQGEGGDDTPNDDDETDRPGNNLLTAKQLAALIKLTTIEPLVQACGLTLVTVEGNEELMKIATPNLMEVSNEELTKTVLEVLEIIQKLKEGDQVDNWVFNHSEGICEILVNLAVLPDDKIEIVKQELEKLGKVPEKKDCDQADKKLEQFIRNDKDFVTHVDDMIKNAEELRKSHIGDKQGKDAVFNLTLAASLWRWDYTELRHACVEQRIFKDQRPVPVHILDMVYLEYIKRHGRHMAGKVKNKLQKYIYGRYPELMTEDVKKQRETFQGNGK